MPNIYAHLLRDLCRRQWIWLCISIFIALSLSLSIDSTTSIPPIWLYFFSSSSLAYQELGPKTAHVWQRLPLTRLQLGRWIWWISAGIGTITFIIGTSLATLVHALQGHNVGGHWLTWTMIGLGFTGIPLALNLSRNGYKRQLTFSISLAHILILSASIIASAILRIDLRHSWFMFVIAALSASGYVLVIIGYLNSERLVPASSTPIRAILPQNDDQASTADPEQFDSPPSIHADKRLDEDAPQRQSTHWLTFAKELLERRTSILFMLSAASICVSRLVLTNAPADQGTELTMYFSLLTLLAPLTPTLGILMSIKDIDDSYTTERTLAEAQLLPISRNRLTVVALVLSTAPAILGGLLLLSGNLVLDIAPTFTVATGIVHLLAVKLFMPVWLLKTSSRNAVQTASALALMVLSAAGLWPIASGHFGFVALELPIFALAAFTLLRAEICRSIRHQ